jgi:hypothetical protein
MVKAYGPQVVAGLRFAAIVSALWVAAALAAATRAVELTQRRLFEVRRARDSPWLDALARTNAARPT